MGNSIAITDGDSIGEQKNPKFILSEMIRQSFLDMDKNNYDNVDKKRACCIKKNVMVKPLPYVDSNNNLKYGTFQLKIFDNEDDLWEGPTTDTFTNKCTFKIYNQNQFTDYNQEIGRHPRPLSDRSAYVWYDIGGHPCDSLYTNIKAKIQQFPNDYNYNNPKVVDDGAIMQNMFVDLGCINSPLTSITNDIPVFGPDGKEITVQSNFDLAYTLDRSCKDYYYFEFKNVDKPTGTTCINISDLKDLKSKDSNINVNQFITCGSNPNIPTQPGGGPTQPGGGPTQPGPTQPGPTQPGPTQPGPDSPSSNTTMWIIIIICVFIALGLIIGGVYYFKNRKTIK